jgi:biopolymer transport protein ExbD
MQGAVNRSGLGIPVLIRADAQATHADVRKAMDACTSVGLWRIKFVALKKPAGAR